ncbi:MAG: hypothetical protein JJE47_03720 [Acidimicrobiia bacterium]|nr:hypothetical protein [Acidimicrobiia bacterium]
MIALLAVLATVAGACGGSASGSGVATLEDTTATTTISGNGSTLDSQVDTETQMLAFAQCMRDEGVDMEDPTVDADGNLGFGGFRGPAQNGGTDGPPDGFRTALDACRPMLEGLELGFGQRDQTEFQDTLLEFAQCMRDSGYPMDDPDLSTFGPANGNEGGPGQRGGPFGDVDFEDPVFQEAQAVCGDILGGFGPGGGLPGGPGAGQDG